MSRGPDRSPRVRRTGEETVAEAKRDQAIGFAATGFGAAKIAETVKLVGEAVEPLMWVAVAAFFTFRARTILRAEVLHQWVVEVVDVGPWFSFLLQRFLGPAELKKWVNPHLWLSDQTGFLVGPLVALAFPAAWRQNFAAIMAIPTVEALAKNDYPDRVVANDAAGQEFIRALNAGVKRDGWWEIVWEVEPSTPDRPLLRFIGLRMQWLPAIEFGVTCVLLGKGGAGLIKGIL